MVTKSQWRLTALAVVAIVVSACNGTAASLSPSAPASVAPTASTAVVASPSPSDDAFAKQWADLIAAAKKEGELSVLTGPEGVLDDGDWLNAFGTQYGIKVTVSGGPTGETTARILAERAQSVYSVDIADLGGSGTQAFLDAKALDQLDPLLINPEVTDRSANFAVDHVLQTGPDAVGICQYIAVQAQTNLISFWYNTGKVTQADVDAVKSFKDFLDPKFKGKIVIGDVAASEADTDAVTMWQVMGQSWWDSLFTNMGVTVVPYGDERTYADGLAHGKWAVGFFPPGSGSLQDAQDAGLPVKEWPNTLAEGNPRSGIQRLCVFKNQPHPAAAQLFANWALMKDGQAALNQFTKRTDRASVRTDVPQGKITDAEWAAVRNTANPFVDENTAEFSAARTAFLAYAKAIYAQLHIVPGS